MADDDFTIPSRNDIAGDMMEAYRAAFPEKNTTRGSDPHRLVRVMSGIAWSVMGGIKSLFINLLPDTANLTFLQRWGKFYSLPKHGPAPSQGVDALLVTGTPSTSVPVGAELAHPDGTLYEITSVGNGGVIDGGGEVTCSIAATSKGLATNKQAGETLTFTSPPPGVNATATLIEDLTQGADTEEVAAYRERVLDELADPREGGAVQDYIKWAREVPPVASAYLMRHRRGLGTLDLAVLGTGSGAARLIAGTSEIEAHVEEKRPANVADWELLTIYTVEQDVDIEIKIDETRYGWDWHDGGVGHTVNAADSSAKTITMATLPSTVVAGVRLTIEGIEALVTNRAGYVLTLATWPFNFGVVGYDIRASGDLVQAVRTAILVLFNQLGPARDERYAATTWDATLRYAKLLAAATDTPGIVDAVLTTPSNNVTLVDPLGTSIPLLVPGAIRITEMT